MASTASARALAAGLLAAVALGVGACGTPRVAPDATPTPLAVIPPTPSASQFVSAVTFTRALGTARMAVDVSTSIDGTGAVRSGEGTVALSQDMSSMVWTSDGQRVHELINDQGTFLQDDIPDGLWTRLPEGETTPNHVFADPLHGLGGLMDLAVEGPDTLDGVEVTRYSGALPADPSSLADMGLSQEQVAALDDAWAGRTIAVTAWADGSRVLRVDRALDLPDRAATASTSLRLSDFGVLTDIEVPPSESVTEKSASARQSSSSEKSSSD
jgi:hypothetical protein